MFGWMLAYLKDGHKMTRKEWKGRAWIEALEVHKHSSYPRVEFCCKHDNRAIVRKIYTAPPEDLFADDWDFLVNVEKS